MIARHITSHDENGMRLLGIGREIHRTPTQQALENLAMDLASREGSVIYAQQRCMDGAAISKAYHCEGRVIVEKMRVLRNKAFHIAQVRCINLVYLCIGYANIAVLYIPKAHNQFKERRLAAAAASDYACYGMLFYSHRYVRKYLIAAV